MLSVLSWINYKLSSELCVAHFIALYQVHLLKTLDGMKFEKSKKINNNNNNNFLTDRPLPEK